MVWGGFFVAMSLTGRGIVQMEINPAYRAFLGVSWLFLVSTCFTLAKALGDAHDHATLRAVQAQRSLCASCERE